MLDTQAIIARGYTTDEEYEEMEQSGKLEKLNLRDGRESEGIWIYPLEDSNHGGRFHFVFFNDPVMFIGTPRAVGGMVGIGQSNGAKQRGYARREECLALFIRNGKAALAYTNRAKSA